MGARLHSQKFGTPREVWGFDSHHRGRPEAKTPEPISLLKKWPYGILDPLAQTHQSRTHPVETRLYTL